MVSYEGMFIINSNLHSDKKDKLIGAIKTALSKEGADIKECAEWGRRKLAYRIKKQTEGLYILVQFDMEPARLTEAKKAYNLNEEILKYLITRK